jgi:hypothetical protein
VTRLAVLVAAAATAVLAWVGGVGASVVVVPLQDSIATPAVTLNGLDQTATATASLSVTDTANAGWALTAWAPPLTGAGGSLGSLVVASQPATSDCSGSGCNAPQPTGVSWPVTLGADSGSATTIYNAAKHTGVGTNVVSVGFTVTVPANTLAGTYTTTVTVAVSNGP